MESLKNHHGIIASLNRANIDTDQIIPKQFLKSISRTGFGENLFFDWRYKPDHSPDPDFSLNRKEFTNASLLVAQNNFGCGSSREHAVWAIKQYGFHVLIAPWVDMNGTRIPGFADIFRNNCVKNSILTIELNQDEVNQIFESIEKNPGLEASADVEKETLTLHLEKEMTYQFKMDPSSKNRLINGLDDIGLTLQHESQITAFESQHETQLN